MVLYVVYERIMLSIVSFVNIWFILYGMIPHVDMWIFKAQYCFICRHMIYIAQYGFICYGAELGSNILIFKTYIDSPNRY